jgi:hypothetical protein
VCPSSALKITAAFTTVITSDLIKYITDLQASVKIFLLHYCSF